LVPDGAERSEEDMDVNWGDEGSAAEEAKTSTKTKTSGKGDCKRK
jgi:hypothetical protein